MRVIHITRAVVAVSLASSSVLLGLAPQPAVSWTSANLRRATGVNVQHVTDILIRDNGVSIWAAFYDGENRAHLGVSRDRGATWAHTPVPGFQQVRVMAELADGSLLLGGTAAPGTSPLVRVRVGDTTLAQPRWEACATGATSAAVPSATADAVWDIVIDADGVLYIAVDSRRNDPTRANPTVLRSTDQCRTLTTVAPLPGLGVLALAMDARGRLYAATEESIEHDDADAAGQARVFYSDDQGRTWDESGRLDGANRVYRLYATRDGTLLAGSGLRGEFFRSRDRGVTWQKTTHVPTGTKPFGDPPVPKAFPATRIYSILELQTGDILVGSGNATGDLYLTRDQGDTWLPTGNTGPSIVSWALAQAPDGTIWVGTGSRGGDVWSGRVTGGAR
jgi:hypothetical protein